MRESHDLATRTSGSYEIGPAARAQDPVDAAWVALRRVYDPELCLDVVSLGLVYDLHETNDTVVVEMTLTTPGCPVSDSLPEQARQAVREAIDPSVGVEVEVVWDPPWNPTMMDDDAAAALGFRRG